MQKFFKRTPRFWLHFSSIFILSTLMVSLFLTKEDAFEELDLKLRDYLFVLRGEVPSSGNVVIVDIDEKSLKEYGQWPWSRDLVAKLVNNIMQSGAYVVGLDMVFAEADKRSPHTIAKALGVTKNSLPNYDQTLANVFEAYAGVVVGGIFLTNEAQAHSFEDSSQTESSIYIEHGGKDKILSFDATILNIPVLQRSLYSNGFLNTLPDKDGTVRSVPIVMKSKATGIYPSLALEMYKVYLGKTGQDVTVTIEGTQEGVEGIYIDDMLYIPTDRFGRLLVNYRGKGKTFKYVSAKDVLELTPKAQELNQTFVLVGTSAIGLFDMRPTPFDSTMPGVEIHATVLDNLLMGDFISLSPDATTLVVALIIAIVILGVLIFSLVHEYLKVPLFIGLLYGLYYLYATLLFKYHLIINIALPLITLVITFLVTTTIDFILTASQKKVIMSAFAKKVSPAVMDNLITHNAKGLLEPVEREISIFFSDIRSFTTISEELGSPKKLIALLNDYMTPMVEIIVKEKGTIDKFIGDAIMAYWNAPIDVENFADHAVLSAIKQIEVLHEIQPKLQKEYNVFVDIGIGINTGVATVGDMGSDGRSDYTIIGDAVNLASRLEGLTKNYGANIIISSFTKQKLKNVYKLRYFDFVKVKGKSEAVEIFEVVVDKSVDNQEIEEFNKAIMLYRDAKIKTALSFFEKLYVKREIKLYKLYIERCNYYIQNPDVVFDVTLTMTTK